MKIEFAPINIPLRRRIQTFAVLQWIFTFLFLGQCCLIVLLLLIFAGYWYIAAVYSVWLYLDWETPNQGGRRSEWVRKWTIWSYFRDYFPIHLVKTADLDPQYNYLFGFHPHGVLVAGAFGNFCTETTGFQKLFPGLTSYLCILPMWFKLPLYRDYIMCAEHIWSQSFPLGKMNSLIRGVFQYSFGLLPYRKPIYTIVGKPIIVQQNHTPSSEEIEALHTKYIEALNKLFEEHKAQYGIPEKDRLLFS
ncbi:2-acylglycerol O-acyltransferase 1-like isoform X3 [Cetorhinus maximus]